MSVSTVAAILLAVVWTTLTNVAYQREHDAAAAMPSLSMRHPLAAVGLLAHDRAWMVGFALEGGGFACYAGAVALGSLALVQSIGAGGIGVLAWLSARVSGRRLDARQRAGVSLSVAGLAALGISLARGGGAGGDGATVAIIVWLVVVALVAAAVLVAAHGRARGMVAVAEGIAGGLFSSIGDLSTKVATQGGARFAFVATLILGYLVGTSLLQLGYQRGATLTVAGIGTLMTNAVPILAGTVVLAEPIPTGIFGVLRIGAFCAVIAGAILLASPGHTPRSG